MFKRLKYTVLAVLVLALTPLAASAQHTFGFMAGYGMNSGRLTPKMETRSLWGAYTGGVSWRYYGHQKFIGGFGIDLEFIQQGFSFAPNASQVEDKKDYLWYTRNVNSIMMPIVWQPHFYMAKNRVRVFLEAAATFSYNLSSKYENEYAKARGADDWKGDYEFRTERDNRWGYGLAGGGGVALLFGRYELAFRARYYFGFSDIVRNRNKYAENSMDGSENPFWYTPLRSPMDNLTITVGLSYRFNKDGFQTWKPQRRREKSDVVFKYAL